MEGSGFPPGWVRPRAGGRPPPPVARPTVARAAAPAFPPVVLQGEVVQCKAFQAALAARVDGLGKGRASGGAEQGLKKDLKARIDKLPATVCEFLMEIDGIVETCRDSFNKELEALVEPITAATQPLFVAALAMGAPQATDKKGFAGLVVRSCSREVIEEGLIQMMIVEWRNPETFLRTTSTFCAILAREHLARMGLEADNDPASAAAAGAGEKGCSLEEARRLNAAWRGYQVPKVLREYVRRQARRLKNSVAAGEPCAARFISDQVFLKHLCPMLAVKGRKRESVLIIRVVNDIQKSAKTGDIADDVWAELKDMVRAILIQVTPPPGR